MHGPSPAANEAFVRSATTFALRSCKRRFSSRSRARRSVTPVSRSHAPALIEVRPVTDSLLAKSDGFQRGRFPPQPWSLNRILASLHQREVTARRRSRCDSVGSDVCDGTRAAARSFRSDVVTTDVAMNIHLLMFEPCPL